MTDNPPGLTGEAGLAEEARARRSLRTILEPDVDEAVRRQADAVSFVPQRASWDCGVAAIAMVAGLTYDEALAAIPDDMLSRAEGDGGLLSVQMPQLLGGLGIALRHTFHAERITPWWKGDRFTGIRLYVGSGHFFVVRPDGRVNDPARGEGLPIESYGEPFDGWEVHRVSGIAAISVPAPVGKRIEAAVDAAMAETAMPALQRAALAGQQSFAARLRNVLSRDAIPHAERVRIAGEMADEVLSAPPSAGRES